MSLRSVCLIAAGMDQAHSRLQPWRYLHQVAGGLADLGHRLLLVSDREPGVDLHGDVQVCRLASVRNSLPVANKDLQALLREHQPQVVLLHIGLLSFLHQDFTYLRNFGSLGIFTNPIYKFNHLLKLGPARLLRRLPLTGGHLLGSLLPGWFVRERIERSRFDVLVVQTHTICDQLRRLGVRETPVAVIPPGVDPPWRDRIDGNHPALQPPIPEDEALVAFANFGPAEELRGFDTLLKAFSVAWAQDPALRLQVLVRRDNGSSSHRLNNLLNRMAEPSCQHIQVETHCLSSGELAARLAAADVVALPFELVSSDAPLSLIEAAALGVPLVTTPVACLPELVESVPHFFARPGDPGSLAQALLQAAGVVRATRKNGLKPGNRVPGQARSWQEVGLAWSRLVQSL